MSNNVRVRPVGFWTFNSAVLPAEFELIDAQVAGSLAANSGGTWAPTSLITIGGLGVTVSGPFNATDAKYISVDTTLQIELGANLQLIGNLLANSGAIVGITSGAFLTVASGGTFTGSAGSIVTLAGTTTLSGTNTLSGTTTISGALTCSNTVTLSKGVTITQSTANTNAITATGNGTGAGASCTGGATGPGIAAVSGTPQTNIAPTCAGTFAGYIQLTGTDPSAGVNPGANNALHAMAIPKAWASVSVASGAGPYTPADSYNISTVTDVSTGVYDVTFVRAMSNSSYPVVFTANAIGLIACTTSRSTTGFRFTVYDSLTQVAVGNAVAIHFLVLSRQ